MWDKVGPNNWRRPLLLQPDNFTPAARTPWGGRRIVDQLKADMELHVQGPVGESWELSVEPDFPSRLAAGPSLDEVLRTQPELLGRESSLGSTALLIKLVDAADDLSLQIHPHDGDPALGANESGKPEAWYIVDADPGAGLYLGFQAGVGEQQVRDALARGGALDALMSFVPVSTGDVFVIEPGTPHAIGKGVLLLEPQRVIPNKRGITYRYWDWNRRYDARGQPNTDGEPRPLHVERALQVTDWSTASDADLIDRVRWRAGPARIDDDAYTETLAGPRAPLRSTSFVIRRLSGTGRIELPPDDRLRGLTVLCGRVTLDEGDRALTIRRGRTAALPADSEPLSAVLDGAHAIVCALA